jgi:hypothetical protein
MPATTSCCPSPRISIFFLERLERAQQDRTLWRLAGSDREVAAFLEPLTGERLDRFGGLGIHDVDIDSRRKSGQNTGVGRVGIELVPQPDRGVVAIDLLLPLLDRRPLAIERERIEPGAAQAQAILGRVGRHQFIPRQRIE